MNIKENIRIAIFSIRANMMRSMLTMLGIIIGVSSVIAIITVGNGGRDYIISKVRDMGQNMVSVAVDASMDTSHFITRQDLEYIRELDNVAAVSPQVSTFGTVKTVGASGTAIVIAGNTDLERISAMNVVEGRFFNQDEFDAGSDVCLIPAMSAQAIFGHSDVINEYISYTDMSNGQTVNLRIIGLLSMDLMGGGEGEMAEWLESSGLTGMMGSEMVMLVMPCSVTDRMTGSDGRYQMIYMMAKDDSKLDEIGNAAVNSLYGTHNNAGSNAYTVQNMASYIDLLDDIITILTTFIAGVSAISLLVGGIGVMNIMLVSVTERTREIGIRKALGARTGTILFQFLTESVILCLIGGAIGFIIGVALAAGVAIVMNIPIEMRVSTIAIAVGFSSAIGIFFGIYPARRAAHMLPIDALRRE
ncbi:MAG: ABC transporter permease [Oscillospiraceae bacterium]|jgi:putative ABC transport system permease protein|nr:ABC transporter permease [Oscillospiraceae bacterium]